MIEQIRDLIGTHRYVAFAGPMGAGKTSLTRRLAPDLGARPFFESVDDNGFLPAYYRGDYTATFPMQLHFLSSRITQGLDIKAYLEADPSHRVIQDRTIYEDVFVFLPAQFRTAQLNQLNFNRCGTLYASAQPALPVPELVIYLQAPAAVLLERIQGRGRAYESPVSIHNMRFWIKQYESRFLKAARQQNLKLEILDVRDLRSDLLLV